MTHPQAPWHETPTAKYQDLLDEIENTEAVAVAFRTEARCYRSLAEGVHSLPAAWQPDIFDKARKETVEALHTRARAIEVLSTKAFARVEELKARITA
jgi:hypothetical protein